MLVVNRNQQVITEGMAPGAYYSRVVNLYLYMAAGVGADDWEITASLGNNIWLREVTLTCFPDTILGKGQAFIYINAGSGKGASLSDVLNVWAPVVQNFGSAKPGFQFVGMQQRFTWQMNKRYMGEARRFGCVVQNLSGTEAMRFWVSFQISEG